VGVAAIAGILVAVLSGGGKAKSGTSALPPGEARAATLEPVPTNHVTGSGDATLRLYGSSARVTLTAHGLLEGGVHLLHIHAGGRGLCPPASAARSYNGHMAISTTDGIPYYGPPVAALTSSGDTSVRSYLDVARFPTTGNINYRREISIPATLAEQIREGRAVVVVHGINYDGSGTYDNVLSHSELLPNEPETLTAPALCGTLLPAPAGSASAKHPHAQVYVASLHLDTNPLDQWCEPARPTEVAPRPRRGVA
jgi:hypothetical protein